MIASCFAGSNPAPSASRRRHRARPAYAAPENTTTSGERRWAFPLLSPAGRFAVGLEREAILLARIRVPKAAVNVRRSNGAARARIRKRLLSRCNGKPICALCGQPIDTSLRTPHPGSMEIDEKLPVSKGGDPFDLDNCQLTHRRCNQRKGNHQYTRLDTPPAPAAQRRAPQPIPLSRQW